MKQYIKPNILCTQVEMQSSLLAGSDPEGSQLEGDVFLSKKHDSSFSFDEEWGDSSWPKSKSAWDE